MRRAAPCRLVAAVYNRRGRFALPKYLDGHAPSCPMLTLRRGFPRPPDSQGHDGACPSNGLRFARPRTGVSPSKIHGRARSVEPHADSPARRFPRALTVRGTTERARPIVYDLRYRARALALPKYMDGHAPSCPMPSLRRGDFPAPDSQGHDGACPSNCLRFALPRTGVSPSKIPGRARSVVPHAVCRRGAFPGPEQSGARRSVPVHLFTICATALLHAQRPPRPAQPKATLLRAENRYRMAKKTAVVFVLPSPAPGVRHAHSLADGRSHLRWAR